MGGPPTAVVLLTMGGADTLDAIRPFLRNLFSDRLIFPLGPAPVQWLLARLIAWRRAPKVRLYYERIGGGSPLNATTRAQARALEAALGERFRCFAAFRYWGQSAGRAVADAKAAGARRVIALPMYPQFCKASTLSSLVDLRVAADAAGGVELVEIDRFSDDAGYLTALTAPVVRMLSEFPPGARPHVIFSAHGVPESLPRGGDPYVAEVEATARAVVARLPPETPWHLAYQSRVGPVKWVEPYTDVLLPRLAAEGVRAMLMVPLTFVSDHVETLDEMDIRLRGMAETAGVSDFRRVPALNDDPAFIAALADLVKRKVAET